MGKLGLMGCLKLIELTAEIRFESETSWFLGQQNTWCTITWNSNLGRKMAKLTPLKELIFLAEQWKYTKGTICDSTLLDLYYKITKFLIFTWETFLPGFLGRALP